MRAAINVVGPEGELVLAGNRIPDHWPADLRASLLASGGAEPEEVADSADLTEPPRRGMAMGAAAEGEIPSAIPPNVVPETEVVPPEPDAPDDTEEPPERRRGSRKKAT